MLMTITKDLVERMEKIEDQRDELLGALDRAYTRSYRAGGAKNSTIVEYEAAVRRLNAELDDIERRWAAAE